jgi:hypothetical protein
VALSFPYNGGGTVAAYSFSLFQDPDDGSIALGVQLPAQE